jgi:predicted dehydrogenase
MGRDHEDLVSVTGRLASGTLFNMVVSRVTPTKVRQTSVVGERGMLVADTLTADLTFYANGTVASDWDMTQELRGVSEGDATRYAIPRREPLLVELEAFCDYVEGDDEAAVVTLAEGAEVVRYAETVLESARRGETVAP